MRESILSLITGSFCGVAFALVKLPVPAPPAISGVLGIVGLWIGYKIVNG